MNKYKLGNRKILSGRLLYRIVALKSFGRIKAGDVGGWVESKKNLSQAGNCWVHDEARVFDDARVYDNAQVYNKAQLYNNAQLCNSAMAHGNARVFGNARIYWRARVCVRSRIFDNAQAGGNSTVRGCAMVHGNARLSDNVLVDGRSVARGDTWLYNRVCLFGSQRVYAGKWKLAPFCCSGIDFPIYQPAPDRLRIGCLDKTLVEWKRHLKRICKVEGKGQHEKYYRAIINAVIESTKHLVVTEKH